MDQEASEFIKNFHIRNLLAKLSEELQKYDSYIREQNLEFDKYAIKFDQKVDVDRPFLIQLVITFDQLFFQDF